MFSVAQSETFPFDANGFNFRVGLQRDLGHLNDDRESEEEDNEEWIAAMRGQNQVPLPPTRRHLYEVDAQIFSPAPERGRERQDDDEGFEDGTTLKRPRADDQFFFEAVQRGDLAHILHAAAQPGFDVNARNDFQATALHIAAGANLINVALLLLELGADPLLTNASGETPAQKAENYGFAELARVLETHHSSISNGQ